MPFQAKSIQIGSNTFLVPNIKGAHVVEDQKLGPSGPVEFTWKNPGQGMLSANEGILWTPNKYLSARGTDAAFPGQVLIQPEATTVSVGSGQVAFTGAPIKQVDATLTGTTNAYMWAGNTIYKTNNDAPPVWQSVGSLGGNTGSDILNAGGIVGVAHGNAGFKRSTDGTTWTADSTSARIFGYLGTNDSTNAPLVWRGASLNNLFSSTGLAGTWSSSYAVGDTAFNLQSMLGIEQVLLVGKEDGIYSIDADGQVVPFTPELRTIADPVFASVGRVTSFNGDYYFATKYGVIQISGADGAKRRVGLDQLASPDLPTPQVRALTSDDRYLYALAQNTTTDLMILRRDIYGAWNVFHWDATAGTKQGQHIGVSSALGYSALFFSYYDGSSTYTTRAIRLSATPNPTQDSNYRYSTLDQDHWVRLGRFGPTESNIILDRCTILADNLTANITVTPYVSTEGAAAAQFGTTAATSSPYTEIKPATALEGRFFDAYAYLDTNAAATSPVLRSISFKGWLQPGRRRLHKYLIAAKGHFTTPQGDYTIQSPVTTIANLETLRTTDGYVTVIDENGDSWSGTVIDVSPTSVDGLSGKEEAPSYVVQATVVEKA